MGVVHGVVGGTHDSPQAGTLPDKALHCPSFRVLAGSEGLGKCAKST